MQGKKPLNIAIGRRIQQSREQAGLTQEELAERIDHLHNRAGVGRPLSGNCDSSL